MKTWQLQQAKARLSELIETARKHGPQIITQRGVQSVVVVPFDDWEKSQPSARPSLLDVLRSSPEGDLPIPSRANWSMRKPVKF